MHGFHFNGNSNFIWLFIEATLNGRYSEYHSSEKIPVEQTLTLCKSEVAIH